MESPSFQLDSNSVYWLSIDVGIVHLALVLIRISPQFELERIAWHQLLDIRKMRHRRIRHRTCQLGHTATITDRMAHVYQEYEHIFQAAERILVERQPPMGLQAVQESLFSHWREKIEIISPSNMHHHFHLSNSYEARKVQTTNIARDFFYAKSNTLYRQGKALEDSSTELACRFESYLDKRNKVEKRSHDVADAICIAVYILSKLANQYKRQNKQRILITDISQLEMFRRPAKILPQSN